MPAWGRRGEETPSLAARNPQRANLEGLKWDEGAICRFYENQRVLWFQCWIHFGLHRDFTPPCEHQTGAFILSSHPGLCPLWCKCESLFLCVNVCEEGAWTRGSGSCHPPEEASSHRWYAAAGVREQGLPCLMLLLSGDQLLFICLSPPGARQQTRDGARGERNIRGIEGSVGQQGGEGWRWSWRIHSYRSTEPFVSLLVRIFYLALSTITYSWIWMFNAGTH